MINLAALIKLFNHTENLEEQARKGRVELELKLAKVCALGDPDAETILAAFNPPQ